MTSFKEILFKKKKDIKTTSFKKILFKEVDNKFVLWFFIILIVSILTFGFFNIFYLFFYGTPPEIFGQIGDSAGMINAAFSGCAFLGIIYTLSIQRKDLKKQDIERKFFYLLQIQENIISKLEFGTNVVGRPVFKKIYDIISESMKRFPMLKEEDVKKICESNIAIIISEHYFRHMYRIIKFVDEVDNSILTDKEKLEYIYIFRATLSPYELLMSFYNGLCHKKMKEFIEKYHILNGMRDDYLPKEFLCFYNDSAYKEGEI